MRYIMQNPLGKMYGVIASATIHRLPHQLLKVLSWRSLADKFTLVLCEPLPRYDVGGLQREKSLLVSKSMRRISMLCTKLWRFKDAIHDPIGLGLALVACFEDVRDGSGKT